MIDRGCLSSRSSRRVSNAPPVACACAIVLLVWNGLPGHDTSAAMLDALVARVAGRVLTLSDLRLARDLGLVSPTSGDDEVLRWLVDRTLMLADLARFQPPDPATLRVDDLVATLRAKVGAEAWGAALVRAGVDEDYAWALARDSVRLDVYLRERFGPQAEPTEEDVRAAYRLQQGTQPEGAPAVAFEAALPALRADLKARRFEALVAAWTAELRARGEVRMPGRPPGAPR
jgi:hypothetical protein